MYLECGLNEHLFQDSLKHFYGQKEKVSLRVSVRLIEIKHNQRKPIEQKHLASVIPHGCSERF